MTRAAVERWTWHCTDGNPDIEGVRIKARGRGSTFIPNTQLRRIADQLHDAADKNEEANNNE